MTKIIIIIIAVYLLYYAGNIIYDLFLKKDSSTEKEEADEYSLSDLAQNGNVHEIGIDDVENVAVPASFNKKELFPIKAEEQADNWDLEQWQKKFETEQDIDSFEDQPEIREQSEEQSFTIPEEVQNPQHDENTGKLSTKRKAYQDQFSQFLSLAETSVQVISDYDGYKIYQSVI